MNSLRGAPRFCTVFRFLRFNSLMRCFLSYPVSSDKRSKKRPRAFFPSVIDTLFLPEEAELWHPVVLFLRPYTHYSVHFCPRYSFLPPIFAFRCAYFCPNAVCYRCQDLLLTAPVARCIRNPTNTLLAGAGCGKSTLNYAPRPVP